MHADFTGSSKKQLMKSHARTCMGVCVCVCAHVVWFAGMLHFKLFVLPWDKWGEMFLYLIPLCVPLVRCCWVIQKKFNAQSLSLRELGGQLGEISLFV